MSEKNKITEEQIAQAGATHDKIRAKQEALSKKYKVGHNMASWGGTAMAAGTAIQIATAVGLTNPFTAGPALVGYSIGAGLQLAGATVGKLGNDKMRSVNKEQYPLESSTNNLPTNFFARLPPTTNVGLAIEAAGALTPVKFKAGSIGKLNRLPNNKPVRHVGSSSSTNIATKEAVEEGAVNDKLKSTAREAVEADLKSYTVKKPNVAKRVVRALTPPADVRVTTRSIVGRTAARGVVEPQYRNPTFTPPTPFYLKPESRTYSKDNTNNVKIKL